MKWESRRVTLTVIVLLYRAKVSEQRLSYGFFVPTEDNVGMWCSLARLMSLFHPSLSLSIKVWDTIIPILCRSLSPSISPCAHCEWESRTQLLCSFSHSSTSSPLSPSPSLMASGEVCEGSSCWNIYWSVFFFQFYLFASLPPCSAILST